MEIPIVSGIYSDSTPALRTSYPVNLMPVPKSNGISGSFIRPCPGISLFGVGPGIDRGGIAREGICYRVMGEFLVRVNSDGSVDSLGSVGGAVGQSCSFTYSFDRLAITSAGRMFYWSPSLGLIELADEDLGIANDVVWIDGYFVITDGSSLFVTELNDPLSINPLKYGSSEVDPDAIVSVKKLRNELVAVNRNTIEFFDNAGSQFFPFLRVNGAQITKGAIGRNACAIFMDTVAFVGGGRNESPSVYLGSNATALKISNQEIDILLQSFTEAELSTAIMDVKKDKSHDLLFIHLPDRTIVYDGGASREMETPVWHQLTSSTGGFSRYRAQNMIWAYNNWLVADPLTNNLGYLNESISSHWGNTVRWEFSTPIIYSGGTGGVINQLELVALPGRVIPGLNAIISTSYSLDGEGWSRDRGISVGTTGDTKKRLVWFKQGHFRNYRIQRFRGDSQSNLSFLRLEAQIEKMAY